jgi:hypothetical protein
MRAGFSRFSESLVPIAGKSGRALLVAMVLVGASTGGHAASFATFDAPGAVHGTFPAAINASGLIAGYYLDADSAPHGFLRAPDGTLTTFDVPGHAGTRPRGLNDEGWMVGQYADASIVAAFVMSPDGKFDRFHFNRSLTIPFAINSAETVTGYFGDYVNGTTGFVRHADGNVEKFNPGGRRDNYTTICCINSGGEVAGSVLIYNEDRGFIRTVGGDLTTFWVTDGAGYVYTESRSLTAAGAITGEYWFKGNRKGKNIFRGYIRAPDGTITLFDATRGKGDTYPCCIDDTGNTAGYFYPNSSTTIARGFRRAADGTLTTFQIPGSAGGTVPVSMNGSGVVAGYYVDGSGIGHGFVGTP